MSARFYRFATAASGRVGAWFFRVSAAGVAAGYFLLFPARVAAGVRFYRALFPDRSRLYGLWCAWRQYLSFTGVFLDRFRLHQAGEIPYDSEGWAYLEKAVERGTGGILLMSHVGNWEVAAHLLRKKGRSIPLLLYMGVKHREQIEAMQKESLARSGIRVIAVGAGEESPFDIIEGIQFLKGGGLVSIAGDVVWRADQRTVPAAFLGHEVRLPEAPHVMALLSGAPLFVLFTFRSREGRYRFTVTEPYTVRAASREDRDAAVRRSAQAYAALLEAAVRAHPFQWYHFRPFLGERIEGERTAGTEEKPDLMG